MTRPAPAIAADLHGNLRQMIAVLESERQALATLEADELFEVTHRKEALCDRLAAFGPETLDAEARELVEAAKALNEVNRRVRNLLAAHVTARLEALGSPRHAYAQPGLALG
jgi:flagellar biosynthesis/type III secretory pathway chaperone